MITSRVVKTANLSEPDRKAIAGLFEAGYQRADPGYLDKSREVFRQVAIAEQAGEVVGFVFADSLLRPLPGLTGLQSIALTGIGCIDDGVRNQGLFSRLAMEAMQAGDMEPNKPVLFAGRMAHVITYRTIAGLADNVVPKPGVAVTAWQYEIASAVAGILGSVLKPNSLVAKGAGKPVGYPRVEYSATVAEQQLFAEVDRDRGDSLLTLAWLPSAPAGW